MYKFLAFEVALKVRTAPLLFFFLVYVHVGLNIYFSIGFKCTFYLFLKFICFFNFLELDSYKFNKAK